MAGNVFKDSPQTRVLSPQIKLGTTQKVMTSNTYGWILGASFFGNTPIPTAIKMLKQISPAQLHSKLTPISEAMAKEDYYPRLQEIKLSCVVICGKKGWHDVSLALPRTGEKNSQRTKRVGRGQGSHAQLGGAGNFN